MTAKTKNSGWQNITDSVIQPLSDIEVFKKVIDALPYPTWIHAVDGMTLYQNKACYDYYLYSPKDIIGVYNFIECPVSQQMVPVERLRAAQKGETVFFPSIKLPLDKVQEKWKVKYSFEVIYLDITVYPVMENGKVKYLVTLQIPCKIYNGKIEIEKAKEYIENNWYEKFTLKNVLAVSGLSKTHFTRLFKQYTGTTAHEYYIRVKINKLKDKLIDLNISINQAFSECNWDHNGHYTKVFKDRVGITPIEYRQSASGKNDLK